MSRTVQWAGGGTVFATRSTTQDSYQPQMSKRLPSCKPERVWETTPWQAPLSTTQSASYANYGNVRRTLPVIPKSRDVNVGPFQGRATSFDAFQPIPSGYAVRKPIYPSSEGRPFGGDVAQGPMTTTQSASYVAHNVKPYVPAKKPTQSLSAFGP